MIRFEDINGQERYGEPIDDNLDGTIHDTMIPKDGMIQACAEKLTGGLVGIALHRGEDVYARVIETESALDLSAVLSADMVQVKKVDCNKTYHNWRV